MSLFNFQSTLLQKQPVVNDHASYSTGLNTISFLNADKLTEIGKAIGEIRQSVGIFYLTNGAWSNVQLLDYILTLTGPADVFFSTWSISTEAIRQFTAWQENGMIKSAFAILDMGIRNRKPEILQQAAACFKNLKLSKCHAKVMVISNADFQITVIGSANMTKNPRKEVGMIIRDRQLAEENTKWILEEFNNGN